MLLLEVNVSPSNPMLKDHWGGTRSAGLGVVSAEVCSIINTEDRDGLFG